jgi:sugar phosphate isomerase/epimerase
MYDTTTHIAPSSLYEQVARGGKALGARNLIASGAAAQDEQQLKAKVAGLNAAGRYCHEQGMGFAYHNEEPESRSPLNELDVLYTETDPQYVRFLFDVGHKFNVGGDVVAFIRKYHQRILGLHLRDYKNHQQVVLGTGDLPLAGIAQALYEVHWSGWVETEEERLDGVKHGEDYLRPAYMAMRKAFAG